MGKAVYNPLSSPIHGVNYTHSTCPGRHVGYSALFIFISHILACFDIEKPIDAAGNEFEPVLEFVAKSFFRYACFHTPESFVNFPCVGVLSLRLVPSGRDRMRLQACWHVWNDMHRRTLYQTHILLAEPYVHSFNAEKALWFCSATACTTSEWSGVGS